jgi:hypothetical protein
MKPEQSSAGKCGVQAISNYDAFTMKTALYT